MSVVAIKSKPCIDTCRSEEKSQFSNFREACATNLSKQGNVQKKPKQRSKKNIEKMKKELNLYCTRAYAKKIELTRENMKLTKDAEVETSEELERDQLPNFLSVILLIQITKESVDSLLLSVLYKLRTKTLLKPCFLVPVLM